jgi:predicted nuclease of predicted toxin-antitoxin system
MRFVVDAQLPPALARVLTAHGHQAEHVSDIGLREADDPLIWLRARQDGAVLVTKDEDFFHRFRQNPEGDPVIVWLRIGNTSRRALIAWFEPLLPEIIGLIERGDRLIEVR